MRMHPRKCPNDRDRNHDRYRSGILACSKAIAPGEERYEVDTTKCSFAGFRARPCFRRRRLQQDPGPECGTKPKRPGPGRPGKRQPGPSERCGRATPREPSREVPATNLSATADNRSNRLPLASPDPGVTLQQPSTPPRTATSPPMTTTVRRPTIQSRSSMLRNHLPSCLNISSLRFRNRATYGPRVTGATLPPVITGCLVCGSRLHITAPYGRLPIGDSMAVDTASTTGTGAVISASMVA